MESAAGLESLLVCYWFLLTAHWQLVKMTHKVLAIWRLFVVVLWLYGVWDEPMSVAFNVLLSKGVNPFSRIYNGTWLIISDSCWMHIGGAYKNYMQDFIYLKIWIFFSKMRNDCTITEAKVNIGIYLSFFTPFFLLSVSLKVWTSYCIVLHPNVLFSCYLCCSFKVLIICLCRNYRTIYYSKCFCNC